MSLRNGTAGRRGRQIACAWRTWQGYNLRVLLWSWLTSMFSGLLPKDLFKKKGSLAKSYFKQNYCHLCHTRFAVFFPLPSCCVSSLMTTATATRKVKKHRFILAKQQLRTCISLFSTFLCRHCTTTMWKCLISRFTEDVNKRGRIFLSLSKLEFGAQDIHLHFDIFIELE